MIVNICFTVKGKRGVRIIEVTLRPRKYWLSDLRKYRVRLFVQPWGSVFFTFGSLIFNIH